MKNKLIMHVSFFTAIIIIASLTATSTVNGASSLIMLTNEDSIPTVISEMTLAEKAAMVTGVPSAINAAGATYAIPRLGIPSIELTDGPAGVRLTGVALTGTKKYATAFPNPSLQAATWNKDIVRSIAKAIGNEAKYYGADVLLAPAINIQRDPLGGRNFEYYSEDPYLTGGIASAFDNGIQSGGIGATLKHFAANSQESNRMNIDEIISERALREIYLTAFETAVRDSKPWAVMAAYNKINGVYCSENNHLLNEILKNEWGFNGFVMSDWGAYHSPIAYKNGLDLNTPGSKEDVKVLIASITAGTIQESDLNKPITNILKAILKSQTFLNKQFDKTDLAKLTTLSDTLSTSSATVAKTAAEEGIVLLKNNNTLPLKKNAKIAVAGENSIVDIKNSKYGIIFEGGGSSEVAVQDKDIVSFVEGLNNSGFTVITNKDKKNFLEGLSSTDASYAAKNSDAALVSIGRAGTEGLDRYSMNLSAIEIGLIKALSDAYHSENKKLIVVLNVAAPVEVASWESYADAVVMVGLPGQQGANAIGNILSGQVNPSGKLTQSWPVKYSDVPDYTYFPTSSTTKIIYGEDIYVGYRYYDTKGVKPMYPFGHGLSYTTFDYSNIKISSKQFNLDKANSTLTVSVDVTNVGNVPGKEVVELYVSDEHSKVHRPYKELKGFAKTNLLNPKEKQTLTFTLNKKDLSYYDEIKSAWTSDPGMFKIFIGGTSDTTKLQSSSSVVTAEFKAIGSGMYTKDTSMSTIKLDRAAAEIVTDILGANAFGYPTPRDWESPIPAPSLEKRVSDLGKSKEDLNKILNLLEKL